MLARGYHFLPVDIYKSDWRVYNIEDGKIRLPFSAIAGVGENAAKQLAQAKDDGMGEFISCDDLMARSGVGKSVVDSCARRGHWATCRRATKFLSFKSGLDKRSFVW